MKVYTFASALICESCGESLRGALPLHESGEEDYPQGPSEVNAHDRPQHCAECDGFLENPLTAEGMRFLRAEVHEAILLGEVADVLRAWVSFYALTLDDLLREIQAESESKQENGDLVRALTTSTLPPPSPRGKA